MNAAALQSLEHSPVDDGWEIEPEPDPEPVPVPVLRLVMQADAVFSAAEEAFFSAGDQLLDERVDTFEDLAEPPRSLWSRLLRR